MKEEEHQTLILLAKRINSRNNNWYMFVGYEDLYRFIFKCLICEYSIAEATAIEEHGIQHLKEKGLLVFL